MILSKKHENSLDIVVDEMKKLKREITRLSISNFVMGQIMQNTHLAGRLNTITQKQLTLYCEKYKIVK